MTHTAILALLTCCVSFLGAVEIPAQATTVGSLRGAVAVPDETPVPVVVTVDQAIVVGEKPIVTQMLTLRGSISWSLSKTTLTMTLTEANWVDSSGTERRIPVSIEHVRVYAGEDREFMLKHPDGGMKLRDGATLPLTFMAAASW